MFINQLREKKYDVVIVGSGPAGISLALRLAQRDQVRVLLVESGGPVEQSKAQILQAERGGLLNHRSGVHQLSTVEATGDLPAAYYALHSQRMFGGTTSVWSGFCTTLEKRAFMGSEWPIDYKEILPYYKGAAALLELPEEAYRSPVRDILPGPCGLRYRPYYLSVPVRFGPKFQARLQEHNSIDVLLNHTCINLHRARGRITGLTLRPSDGVSLEDRNVTAGKYVLACGGVGNARLMQLADVSPTLPTGDLLMDHPHIYNAGKVELRQDIIDPVLSKGKVVHALQLSDEFCLSNRLLSFTVSFNVGAVEDRLILGERQRVYVSSVTIRSEMAPLPGNRVSLGEGRDYLGQLRARVDFKFDYQHIAKASWDAFARELLASGIGRAVTPGVFDQPIGGGGHIIGTTRMGISDADSVVDGDCKVHGTDNLFIMGSSIFPSSAAANPTFSIVAFSLRLGDHLAEII